MKVRIYTDGACSPNPGVGGYASILCLPKEQLVCSGNEKYTTNNRMELQAIISSLSRMVDYLCRHDLPLKELEILSDSSYVISGINRGWLKRQIANGFISETGEETKNKDLWLEFVAVLEELDFISDCKVKFKKVKGHSGNYFNEKVDQLAKKEIIKRKNAKR